MTWHTPSALPSPPHVGAPSSGTYDALVVVMRTVSELVRRGHLPSPSAHDYSVMWLSYRIANNCGVMLRCCEKPLSAQQVLFAGVLHDVGKAQLSPEVLNKPSALTTAETEHVRQHPRLGHQHVSALERPEFDAEVLGGILHHHERYDGAGYPAGLAGQQIPLLARIIAVADVYSALTHARPYREAWSRSDAVEHMQREAGAQFDPWVVRHFMPLVR